MKSLLLENASLKILSVLIALAMWFIVRDERVDQTVSYTLEVDAPPSLVVADESVPEIEVSLQGTRPDLDRVMRVRRVHPIRVRTTDAGVVTVRLRPEDIEVPAGVHAFDVHPGSVTLRLEHRATKRVPVRARLLFESGWRAKKTSITPERVRISGPGSVVANVEEIWTEAVPVAAKDGPIAVATPALTLPHRQVRVEDASTVQVKVEMQEDVQEDVQEGTAPVENE